MGSNPTGRESSHEGIVHDFSYLPQDIHMLNSQLAKKLSVTKCGNAHRNWLNPSWDVTTEIKSRITERAGRTEPTERTDQAEQTVRTGRTKCTEGTERS